MEPSKGWVILSISSQLVFLKRLLRSGSVQFASDFADHPNVSSSAEEHIYTEHGYHIHYRAGSSDVSNIHDKLLKRKCEYWLPEQLQPKVILDIGGNIGIASIFFAQRFPDAQIHAFEPSAANFAYLEKNTQKLTTITAHHFGLGLEDENRSLYGKGTKFGSYTLVPEGKNPQVVDTIRVRPTGEVLRELNLPQIDLIKIDTEGFEYPILTSFPIEVLEKVTWIVGELHSKDDFKLLAYLEPYFDLDFKKTLTKDCYKFNAVNRNWLKQQGSSFELKALQY